MAARKSKNVVPATLGEVREWGREQGKVVGTRGRLPKGLGNEFTKATGRPIGAVEAPAER